MPNSQRMQWPYPAHDTDPWISDFEAFVNASDASGYAAREDRNTLLTGGGEFSFNASSGELSWSEDIEILSAIPGRKATLSAGAVELDDGGSLYIDLTRGPGGNTSVSGTVSPSVPNTDNALLIAMRVGNYVYFRNGSRIGSGEVSTLFDPIDSGFAEGEKDIDVIKVAGRESHNSDFARSVGAMAFRPSDYERKGFSRNITFRAIASTGSPGITAHVRLVNITDGDTIATLSFTSVNIAKDETVVTVGNDPGDMPESERLYEARIFLDEEPDGEDDTVELYSVEIRISNVAQ